MEPHGHHKQNLLCMLYSRWSSRSSSTSSSGGNDAKTPQRPENGGSATDQKDAQRLVAEVGAKETGGTCEGERKDYDLKLRELVPTVSNDALAASFKVLMAAFVLAVLLESAFALLFNWRVYKIYLAGQAWRTVIMFGGAFVVVNAFHFDLVASLMDAYFVSSQKTKEVFGTSILTAMILAGGSSGINAIFISLGLRAPQQPEQKMPKNPADAWLSVRVNGTKQAQVNISAVTPTNTADIPTTVGITGTRKPPLKEVLFGAKQRVPEFSGYRVNASSCYAITVTDSATGTMYDVSGKQIKTLADAQPYRFAAGSLVDFTVDI